MRIVSMLVLAGLAASASSAAAFGEDSVAAFYKGKTITIFAGSTPGGGVDLYARLLGQTFGKYIPGHPAVIVQDEPGAGSLVAAHNLYSVAPKDGTQMAVLLPGGLFDPLMKGRDLKDYDPPKFNFLGNANLDATVCVARSDAPVKTYADVFKKEFVVAGSGPGSVSVDYPVVERNLLGAKLKVVSGYPGSSEIRLAIYHNETQGVCGEQWSSAKQQFPEALQPGGSLKILAEEDTQSIPALKKMGVPLVIDFAKTDEQKRVLGIFMKQGTLSRPVVLPPGVPADRLAALRKAFDEAMRDPDLLATAAKERLDVNPKNGEETRALVASVYDAPAALIATLRKASVADQ